MIPFPLKFILVLLGTFFIGVILTPLVRLLAFKIGAVDYPNARRINKKPMPSSGGLAIVIAFSVATLVFMPMIVQATFHGKGYFDYIWPVVLGGGIIALTGLIDDVKELKPLAKMSGIVLAASLIWLLTDFRLNHFKIPFGGPLLHFAPWLSFILTVIWIISITNAVNLIDGLDGLVSGVSIISLVTMGIVSYFFLPDHNVFLTLTIFVLVMSIAGFFPYNYHPAIIYLGDTGALFIGFMIAVLSLQGLKNATAVAVITPMIILGVPITDTFLAIVRRTLSGQKFYTPDKRPPALFRLDPPWDSFGYLWHFYDFCHDFSFAKCFEPYWWDTVNYWTTFWSGTFGRTNWCSGSKSNTATQYPSFYRKFCLSGRNQNKVQK